MRQDQKINPLDPLDIIDHINLTIKKIPLKWFDLLDPSNPSILIRPFLRDYNRKFEKILQENTIQAIEETKSKYLQIFLEFPVTISQRWLHMTLVIFTKKNGMIGGIKWNKGIEWNLSKCQIFRDWSPGVSDEI